MKIQCNHCGKWKDESQFSWRWKALGKRQGACKECKAEQDRASYDSRSAERIQKTNQTRQQRINEARQYVWDYLSTHPCSNPDCENRENNPAALEFHHVRGHKKGNISALAGQGYSLDVIKAEIAKCEVLCVKCHRLITYDERGWFRG